MFSQKAPKNGMPAMTPRAKYEQQYKTCRMNLLLVILFTIISMVTIYSNGSYFLFSAFIPLIIFATGTEFAAIVSDPEGAIAVGYTAADVEVAEMLGVGGWIGVGAVLALIILAVYFICWLVSKKHPAAMVVAAAFFAIDCVVLLLSFDTTMIIDLIFHAWVMFYLILAIVANAKLKKLPPEEDAPVEGTFTVADGSQEPTANGIEASEIPAENDKCAVQEQEQPAEPAAEQTAIDSEQEQ